MNTITKKYSFCLCFIMICFFSVLMMAVRISGFYAGRLSPHQKTYGEFSLSFQTGKSALADELTLKEVSAARRDIIAKITQTKTADAPLMKTSANPVVSAGTDNNSSLLLIAALILCALLMACSVYLLIKNLQKSIINKAQSEICQKLRIASSHVAELIFEYRCADKAVTILNEHPFIRRIPLGSNKMTIDSFNRLLHPDDSEMMVSLCERMHSGEAVVSATMRLRSTDEDDEDGYHWYQVTFTCIFDASYKPIYSIGTLVDIADQKLLQDQAQHDPLTGVLNRNEFEKRIESELAVSRENNENKGVSALLMLDLDDFKSINDTSSHIYGDKVLRALTYQLHQVFRATDIIGRLGGDEFVVFLKDMPSVELVTKKIEELQSALITGDGQEVKEPISLSIGVVLLSCGDCFNDLYRKADVALYIAKERGKNQYVIYDA